MAESVERALFFKGLKRFPPFEEDVSQPWNKVPKLDALLSKISKNSHFAFDGMGTLKDPMDKRGDVLLP